MQPKASVGAADVRLGPHRGVANIGGLGLGPLVSGLVARYLSDPLRVVFAVDLGLLVLAACAVV